MSGTYVQNGWYRGHLIDHPAEKISAGLFLFREEKQMKKIYVSDFTLRSSYTEKKELTFRERLNIASRLDDCGIDAIELPLLNGDKENDVIYKTVAKSVENSKICIPVGDSDVTVESAWECIKDAVNPCLQVVLPVSTVQMEYVYHVKSAKLFDMLSKLCNKARSLCSNVEFVALDASRADNEFLVNCCKIAKENGAGSVTLCDDSGVFFPEDFADLVKKVKSNCDIEVFIQPSDTLRLAAASFVEAVKAGADGIKISECGAYLNAHTLADIFRAKSESMCAFSTLDSTKIGNLTDDIYVRCEARSESKKFSVMENGDIETVNYDCTLSDLTVAVKELGYELSDEDNAKVFEAFKRVAEKKNKIDVKELEAIVASVAMQVPATYHLVNYVVNSGNIITATANVTLQKDGQMLSGVSTGDGPIDAAFHAIEQIIGHHYELDDFQVQAVTKGREAVGSSVIRLRADGKLYSGNGISTDIVGACIRAYVNALNKIVYEEN